MSDLNLNIPISKIDEEQRIIGGWATVEELDKQGEITDYQASKKAFSNWEGNIREMHDPLRAIGKKVSVAFDDDNKAVFVSAKISESADGQNAWTKIKEGILTGFSIGGRVLKMGKDTVKDASGERTVNRIMDYELSELSVVDNPAVPSAMLTVVKSMGGDLYEAEVLERNTDRKASEWWQKYYAIEPGQLIEKANSLDNNSMDKREFSNKERADLAESGKALPDGSYPIKSVQDLKNAIQSIGRAKNPARVRAHIKTRAQALGRSDLIPDSWKAAKATFTKSVCDADVLTDLAQGLVWYINKEEAEGEDMSGVRNALALIQQEIANEVLEGDDFDEETLEAVYLAATIKDLRKDNNMAKEIEKDMYGKRPGNAVAQDAIEPGLGAPMKERGEMGESADGGGASTNKKPAMSGPVGSRNDVAQSMYDVRDHNGDAASETVENAVPQRLEAETGSWDTDYSDEGELEAILGQLHAILSRRGMNIEQASRARVMSGGKPTIYQSAQPDFTKNTDLINKAFSDQFGKVERVLSSLVDRVERLEVQPASKSAVKAEYAVVEKSVEVEAPVSELDSLLKQADAAANNPNLDMSARSELALKIRKAQRAKSN